MSHSFDEFGKTPLTLQLTFQQQKFSTERYLREIKKDKLFLKSLELGNPRALESVYRQFRMHDIKGLYIPDAINSYIKKYKKIKKIDEGRKVLKIKNDAKALLLYKKLNASYYISHIYATGGDGVPLDIEQSEKYAWESFYNGSSIPDTLSSHFIKTPNPSFKYYFFLTSYGNRNYNFYVFVQKFNEFLKRDLDKGIISDVNARSIRNELFEVFKKREQRRYEKIPYVSPLFLKNYYEKSPVKDEELMKKIVLTYYENGLYDCL